MWVYWRRCPQPLTVLGTERRKFRGRSIFWFVTDGFSVYVTPASCPCRVTAFRACQPIRAITRFVATDAANNAIHFLTYVCVFATILRPLREFPRIDRHVLIVRFASFSKRSAAAKCLSRKSTPYQNTRRRSSFKTPFPKSCEPIYKGLGTAPATWPRSGTGATYSESLVLGDFVYRL